MNDLDEALLYLLQDQSVVLGAFQGLQYFMK